MKRPTVEEFKRLTSQPASAWGMADSDVVELCDYILHLEATLQKSCPHYGRTHHAGGWHCPRCNERGPADKTTAS